MATVNGVFLTVAVSRSGHAARCQAETIDWNRSKAKAMIEPPQMPVANCQDDLECLVNAR